MLFSLASLSNSYERLFCCASYDDFKLLSHIARFDKACQEIEYHGQEKEDIG